MNAREEFIEKVPSVEALNFSLLLSRKCHSRYIGEKMQKQDAYK